MVRQGWTGKGKLGAIAGNLALLFSSFLFAMPRVAAVELDADRSLSLVQLSHAPQKSEELAVRQENLTDRNIKEELQRATADFLEERIALLISESTESSEETVEETPSEIAEPEPQVLVSEVVVDGRGLTPDLEELIYNTVSTKSGRTTTRGQLQEDVNAIFATGFFANVTQIPSDTPLGVRITFRVEVNPILSRVVVRNLPQGIGDPVISQDAIDEIFEAGYGETLNLRDLQEGIIKLNEWYQENGYDLAQVLDTPNASDDGVVTLVVAEGIIEEVRIRFFNNEQEEIEGIIPLYLITNEMKLSSGAAFKREIAQKDLQKIWALGFFKDARLSFSPGTNLSQVIVNVDVESGVTLLDLGEKLHNKNYNEALNIYQKALNIYYEENDIVGQSLALMGLADVYAEYRQNYQALEFYHQSLSLWNSIIKQLAEDSNLYFNEDYTTSVNFGFGLTSKPGIVISSHGLHGLQFGKLMRLLKISESYRLLGEYQQVIEYINLAEQLWQKYNPIIVQEFITLVDKFDKTDAKQNVSDQVTIDMILNLIEPSIYYLKYLIYSEIGQEQKSLQYKILGKSKIAKERNKINEMNDKSLISFLNLYTTYLDAFELNPLENSSSLDIESLFRSDFLTKEQLLSFAHSAYYNEKKDRSLSYLIKLQEIYQTKEDTEEISNILQLIISQIYFEQDDINEAINTLNHFSILQESDNQGKQEIYTLLLLGKIYSNLGQYQKSITYLEKGLKISEKLNDFPAIAKLEIISEIAKIKQKQNKVIESVNLIKPELQKIEYQVSKYLAGDKSIQLNSREDYIWLLLYSEIANIEYRLRNDSDGLSIINPNQNSDDGNNDQQYKPNNYQQYEKISSYLSTIQDHYEFYIERLIELYQKNPDGRYDIQVLEASENIRYNSLLYFINRNLAEHKKILNFSQTFKTENVQNQILDDETVLLEYGLGKNKSFLLLVTQDEVQIFELPSKTEIEETAREFYNHLTEPRLRTKENKTAEIGLQLSEMILAPVADRIQGKRLLIVADGALQYIPFSAIPNPRSLELSDGKQPKDIAKPLLLEHEIVHLPSALTLAAIRQRENNRPPANKTLAVFADPVFGRGDSNQIYAPLPRTREQAERISATLPANSDTPLLLYGDDADRDRAIRALEEHQIVHFATHGILDTQNPTRSGVVLSAYDKQGNIQRGLISTSDLFNLDREIAADLVFLSGCRTGLGKEYRGEGIVGLTGGFLSAGAERVVVSLWSVEQEATIELTERFYQQMFDNNLSPAAALRAAQISMWEDPKWKNPYNWAAFTIQGEWKEMQ